MDLNQNSPTVLPVVLGIVTGSKALDSRLACTNHEDLFYPVTTELRSTSTTRRVRPPPRFTPVALNGAG